MALKDILALVDDKLEAVFHRKEPDAKKVRKKAIATIETARKQFGSVDPVRGRKVWKISNEVVSFTPGYVIAERTVSYVPAERFNDFLDKLEAAINAGELDDALLADEKAEQPVKVRKPRGPLSPEVLAARRAKMAAKK